MSNFKLFESTQIRSVWNEDQQHWYFANVNVVQVLTESVNPTDYLKNRDLKALGQTGDNLRDHMTDLELIFTMLGEASTTEITRQRDAQGFDDNHQSARTGGKVVGDARRDLERPSGSPVATAQNYKPLPEAAVRKRIQKTRTNEPWPAPVRPLMKHLMPTLLGDTVDEHEWRIHPFKRVGRLPKNLTLQSDARIKTLLDKLPKMLEGYGRSGCAAVLVASVR